MKSQEITCIKTSGISNLKDKAQLSSPLYQLGASLREHLQAGLSPCASPETDKLLFSQNKIEMSGKLNEIISHWLNYDLNLKLSVQRKFWISACNTFPCVSFISAAFCAAGLSFFLPHTSYCLAFPWIPCVCEPFALSFSVTCHLPSLTHPPFCLLSIKHTRPCENASPISFFFFFFFFVL